MDSGYPAMTKEEREPSGFFDIFKGKPQYITLMKCANCNAPHSDPGTVQLETEKTCTKDRLYYENDFKKISDTFRLKRPNFPEAKFPTACVAYAMRTWDAYEETSKHITECKDEETPPEQGRKLACVTENYAYSTYNSYVDVMDCLSIPQKELLPKIWNESFFHVNAYGDTGDSGVGQLTDSAIKEVIKPKYADMNITELEFYKREMTKSGKASCSRILADSSAWIPVSEDKAKRCSLMRPTSSPLRNLLYTAIFYRVVAERISGIYYRAGKEMMRTDSGLVERSEKSSEPGGAIQKLQFKEKMQQLGIANPDMDYLRDVLVTLAFNAGSSSAIKIVNDFLQARIANGMKLEEKELDFINVSTMAEKALVSAPKDETEDAKTDRLKKLDAARETAYKLELPRYMRLMQVTGLPGYVSSIGYRASKFNQEIGENVCTPESFLQHSLPASQPAASSPENN
jgi:hypothetical protein